MSVPPLLIFAIRSYDYLQGALCRRGNFEAGVVERQEFPDGERYLRIITKVAGREVALAGGTISDADTLELYDLACAAVKYGARTLTLIIPYYAYSTMERAVRSGEVVTAKTRACLFSAIPPAPGGNRVALLDLHSEGITYYFEGSICPTHLYAKPVIIEAIRELGGDDFVLAGADAGRAKWVQSLANDINVKPAFVLKKRLSAEKTEISAIFAPVENRHVIIYDDMIRTGNSIINAARAYSAAGAAKISAVVTHGLFPGDALARIKSTGLLQKIICTDSHPRAVRLQDDFLGVKSIAGLLGDFLKED